MRYADDLSDALYTKTLDVRPNARRQSNKKQSPARKLYQNEAPRVYDKPIEREEYVLQDDYEPNDAQN